MKFPIDQLIYPDNHRCPICRKKFNNKFLCLNICCFNNDGTVGNEAGISWTLTENNHHVDRHRSVDIIDVKDENQSDIYVCSSKCLRAFFNKIVDNFEK